MNPLKIGTDASGKTFALPLDLVTQTIAILARKGKGKSYLADVFAEELLEAGQIPVVIDPTGAHWGLKSSAALPMRAFVSDELAREPFQSAHITAELLSSEGRSYGSRGAAADANIGDARFLEVRIAGARTMAAKRNPRNRDYKVLFTTRTFNRNGHFGRWQKQVEGQYELLAHERIA